MRYSLVSCKDVKLQTQFLFWHSYSSTYGKNELLLCICTSRQSVWLGAYRCCIMGIEEARHRGVVG